jgi:tRNA dimethylallyltransferase
MSNKKLIVIVGPTASGKSALAVKIALWLNSAEAKKRFGINGAEIISADSRQVYKGLDIGAGKITKKEMKGVPHHLLSVASPKRTFTVARYKKLAREKIAQIWRQDKIPIICGGTGFYIQAAVDGLIIPEVKPNPMLRKKLEKMTADKLYKMLQKKDPRRVKNIDKKNKRRLIRALEIIEKLEKVPPLKTKPLKAKILFIGIKKEKNELYKLIRERLEERFDGIISETRKLVASGVSLKRLENFGLEYKWAAKFIKGEVNKKEMLENLFRSIKQYAKRQMTWWKKDPRIQWIKTKKENTKLIQNFLFTKTKGAQNGALK